MNHHQLQYQNNIKHVEFKFIAALAIESKRNNSDESESSENIFLAFARQARPSQIENYATKISFFTISTIKTPQYLAVSIAKP